MFVLGPWTSLYAKRDLSGLIQIMPPTNSAPASPHAYSAVIPLDVWRTVTIHQFWQTV